MIAYENADRAAAWLVRAFGFRELQRFSNTKGVVTDVLLERDGAQVLVGHPSDAYQGPTHHAESCVHARKWLETPYIVDGVCVLVDDVDAHYAAAVAAGAKVLSPVETNAIQRQYRVEDLEGHRWMFAKPV
jgi:uncharacterized glyoxalase superfamily protein PhnB